VLTYGTRRAVGRLAEAVASVHPLVDVLDRPVRVASVGRWPESVLAPPPERAGLAAVLHRVAGRFGPSPFVLAARTSAREIGTFERVVSERLHLDAVAEDLLGVPARALPEVDAIVDEVRAEDFDGFCRRERARGADGVPVWGYAAGEPHNPAIVLAPACGMPARLTEGWMRWLAKEYHVLTWESRGLFGTDLATFDGATDVLAQAGDLLAVMDHFGVARAHVAGLCAGSVIALAAVELAPHRVSSLSLWHGGYGLGGAVPPTDHHRNLHALTRMVAEGRVSAASVHASLSESTVANVPADLAHLVLYPYATAPLLLRYCQLNGPTMEIDARRLLSGPVPRTLVVTSEDDQTANPDQSRYVASRLPDARLLVRPTGDHLSLFRAPPELLRIAAAFAAGEEPS
jgi:3-oxoadipate enol-lactonase